MAQTVSPNERLASPAMCSMCLAIFWTLLCWFRQVFHISAQHHQFGGIAALWSWTSLTMRAHLGCFALLLALHKSRLCYDDGSVRALQRARSLPQGEDEPGEHCSDGQCDIPSGPLLHHARLRDQPQFLVRKGSGHAFG